MSWFDGSEDSPRPDSDSGSVGSVSDVPEGVVADESAARPAVVSLVSASEDSPEEAPASDGETVDGSGAPADAGAKDDDDAKGEGKRRARAAHKAAKPTVPASSVKSVVRIVKALEDGFVPLAKVVVDTQSNDVYSLAGALTELKSRRRMEQFVRRCEQFAGDSAADRGIDMALAMRDEKDLSRALFAAVAALGVDAGRSAGAGRELDDSKRLSAAFDSVDVSRLRDLVY